MGKQSPELESNDYHEMAVKDLKLHQLQLLRVCLLTRQMLSYNCCTELDKSF